MKYLFFLTAFICQITVAQKFKKADKLIITSLQTHVNYLASDKLEGRRTGTAGEKKAYEYISNQFLQNGLTPKGDDGTFIQTFEVNEGKQINSATYLFVNDFDLELNKDYFPLTFSPNGQIKALPSMALRENGNIWFLDLNEMLEKNKDNPHYDLENAIKIKVADFAKKGAICVIVYNSSKIDDGIKFEPKAKVESVQIPVVYVSKNIKNKFFNDETAVIEIRLKVDIGNKIKTGHNVVAYINNGAVNTVILGAHYDHLGYGEDHNSLYVGTDLQIHNGADDNASGTAALIELSKLLKTSKDKSNNYLFVSFSGEELGLFGSKYFVEHAPINLSTANYMINMDMVGRLNEGNHGLSIGGYGTSPTWGQLLKEKDKYFTIKFDSSGSGPSDHTSFYRKDIPVLFFFTGTHSDYHKPTDDADKINFNGQLMVLKYINNVISAANKKGKLTFTKTRETQAMGKSSFKVTLGIMPDYTYSGSGVRVDGVSDGKVAQKVGIKTGDIIMQLGENKFTDVQSYMGALGKFNKGDATKLKVLRGKEELIFDIIF